MAVVTTEYAEGIATITLNRPEAMNALNQEMVDALYQALEESRRAASVKVIVLTGCGRAFTAGGDLGFLSEIREAVAARRFIMSVGQLVKIIMEMEKPVIAMVNGVAAGAGFNLALACDLVFCARSARFAQSFVKVGLVPDCGGLYLLPRIVGMHKAKELMLTADLIDAGTALALQVVNQVVDDAELKHVTYQFAGRLVQAAPLAAGMIKRMVNRSESLDLDAALELEADLQTICLQTQDHQEGVAAFKEKRTPVFNGK